MAGSTTGKSVFSGVIGQAGMCAEGKARARGGLTRFSEGCFRQLMGITQPACPAKPPTVQLFLYRILSRRSSLVRNLELSQAGCGGAFSRAVQGQLLSAFAGATKLALSLSFRLPSFQAPSAAIPPRFFPVVSVLARESGEAGCITKGAEERTSARGTAARPARRRRGVAASPGAGFSGPP